MSLALTLEQEAKHAMYRTLNGEEIFVIGSHSHLWVASPENQLYKGCTPL
jgi:hypothetical protein